MSSAGTQTLTGNEAQSQDLQSELLALATGHACWQHPLFDALEARRLSVEQAGKLLRNYDAHASALRRLLLKAATLMPDPAVGFVLENVRNEFGNGDYSQNHQQQLLDVAWAAGVDRQQYKRFKIEPGIRTFIASATSLYAPKPGRLPQGLSAAAVAAGAITATEILALREFRYLQTAFETFELQNHKWFDHVVIEAEHTDESLALALYFIETNRSRSSVEFGLLGILQANLHLYDGLLSCLR